MQQSRSVGQRALIFSKDVNCVDKTLKIAIPILTLLHRWKALPVLRLRKFCTFGRGALGVPIAFKLFYVALFERPRPGASESLKASDVVMPLLIGLIAVSRTMRVLDHSQIRVIQLGAHRPLFWQATITLFAVSSSWGLYHSKLEFEWAESNRSERGDGWADNKHARARAILMQSSFEMVANTVLLLGLEAPDLCLGADLGARVAGIANCWLSTESV